MRELRSFGALHCGAEALGEGDEIWFLRSDAMTRLPYRSYRIRRTFLWVPSLKTMVTVPMLCWTAVANSFAVKRNPIAAERKDRLIRTADLCPERACVGESERPLIPGRDHLARGVDGRAAVAT